MLFYEKNLFFIIIECIWIFNTYFVNQQGIKPATEDPRNEKGAKWAMRDIPSGDIDNIWLSCLDKAIGDKCPHLNGIVTQVKNNLIWNLSFKVFYTSF